MHPNSLHAYREIMPTLSPKRRAVFACVAEFGPATDTDIAKRLGWPINCVTGRVGELLASHHLIEQGSVERDGRPCRMTAVNPALARARERQEQKAFGNWAEKMK